MGEIRDPELEAAHLRGEEAKKRELRPEGLSLVGGALVFQFAGGATVSLPLTSLPELAGAPEEALAELVLHPGGWGLSCEPLDLDLDTTGLIMDHLMGEGWREAIGRWYVAYAMSGAKTEKKAKASRANGKKGGRPRKKVA